MEENKKPMQRKAQSENKSSKKRRGRRKIFSNPWTYLLFVFGVSAILAATCWTIANDVLALNKGEHSAVITITEDDSFSSIVNQIEDNGIIEYKSIFKLFTFVTGGKKHITEGTYVLNTEMDYRAIISGLSARSNQRMTTVVTIPEGYNVDQIFALLEEKGVSTVAKLREMSSTHDYAFSFLEDIPIGNYKRLEGYLFPDTYEFYMGENPLYVLNKMLVNFDAKVTDEMRAVILDRGYTIQEMMIIASMIEKETDGTDRGKIASVIRNRLEKPTNETVGFLNVDATLQYVLPDGEEVTQDHYQTLESPYNTYKYKGLPPTPIANPGIETILAAMNPDNTDYYYYALGDDDLHHFFKTHDQQVAFLGW